MAANGDVVELAQQLVRIPSVNPMGRLIEGDMFLEFRMANFLESWFADLGIPSERTTVELGRDNIVACLPGAAAGTPAEKILVLEAHQDTVPVDGMVVEPFGAQIENGRLYGRGAVDIKGGMAAILAIAFELVVAVQSLVFQHRPYGEVQIWFCVSAT
jgi:acetylornithine deacetylase